MMLIYSLSNYFMKLFSHLSLIRSIGYLLVFILCVNCKKDYTSKDPSQLPPESISQSSGNLAGVTIISQTRTSNVFNWNGNNPYVNLWAQEGPGYVSADDGSYAYSKKLSSGRSFLSLVLQDFDFDIPSNAIIENITVSARRFKTGKGSIRDFFATLVIQGSNLYNPRSYGVRWTHPDNYPGEETEVLYTQNGSGTINNVPYLWTPALINDQAFGVRIQTEKPQSSVTVYYDLVEITVEYSLP